MSDTPSDTATDRKPWLFDSERAKAAARKSVEVRQGKDSNPPSLPELRDKGPELLAELINAAEGRGKWRELSAEKRLDALKIALQYTLGRPKQMNDAEEEAPAGGFVVTQRPE